MLDSMMAQLARASRSLPALRGRGRIALALQRTMPSMGAAWVINMTQGHYMEVPANSAQTWRAAFTGGYDDVEIEMLASYVRPRTFVLDVGSSLGFYAIPLARAAMEVGARLVAIEPVKANCEIVRRNLELNGLDKIADVLPVALGAEEGQVVLHVETGGTGNAAIVSGLDSSLVAHHDKVGGTSSVESAEVRRLDDLDLPVEASALQCSVMKIDAEGFEMEILAGARRFVANHRPVIFGEFHPAWLETRGLAVSAPQEWAVASGYEAMQLSYSRSHFLLDAARLSLRSLSENDDRSGAGLLLRPRELGSPH